MKKRLFSIVSLALLTFFLQAQEQKNIVGFGAGYCPSREAYIDGPQYIWVRLKASPVYELFYARELRPGMRLGGYFEYQSASFQNFNSKATRYNVGVNWLSLYPSTAFHGELGGYFGYGSLKADGWDQSLTGTDYGIIIGPAYEKNNFGVALHFQCGFGYYKSTGVPDEVDFSMPRYILKVYYKF